MSVLKTNRDLILIQLAFHIESVDEATSVKMFGRHYTEISRCFRAAGICDLLIDADTEEFFHSLIRSAQTRKYYLGQCRAEEYLTDFYATSSRNGPFLDAVVAGQFGLAQDIARLTPMVWRERDEYEDDFAYARFLYSLVLNSEDLSQHQMILNQFEIVLGGESSPRLNICKSFQSRDQQVFDEAFNELLQNRKKEIAEDKNTNLAEEVTFEPEACIFIEGLALLKVAEKLNLNTEAEYPMCPALARQTLYAPFEVDGFPGMSL